jgi:tripartite-type tricarboxylate transporter receptor subunit TctC
MTTSRTACLPAPCPRPGRRVQLARWLALALAAPLAGAALAQTAWPDKPIRVVLPFPPGGPSDMVIRTVSDKLQTTLRQPIVVDNRAGAGGNLGTAEVARAAPDGHTWLWVPDSVITVNPHVYKQLGFKVDDLVPVSLATQFSSTLVCHPKVGVKTVSELVAKAKAGPMTYASGGAGVPGHLSMELLKSMAGFEMTHVPYKGPAPAMQDVLGGQVDCGLLAGPTVLPHVRSGRLVALGVSGVKRSPMLPEVPTIDEAGVKGDRARPNIIFIVADDLGFADLGCYGGRDAAFGPVSPVLDGWPPTACKLTQGYSNSPVCSPTRFALMTGALPVPPARRGRRADQQQKQGQHHAGPAARAPHAALAAARAGYRTALMGKWHLGYPPAFGPLRSGYESSSAPCRAGWTTSPTAATNGTHDLYLGEPSSNTKTAT